MSSETEGSRAKLKNKEIASENRIKKNKKKEVTNTKPLEYKDFDVDTKIYYKVAILMHKCGIDYSGNKEVIQSFIDKLGGLFANQSKPHQLEALEFVILSKPKDMIEIHHLLNLFTVSDYMRICRIYIYSNTATHEQNQEYIRLSGKIMEQYSKGMLSLKMYREGIPQIQNNKIQNNTLNQVNIHGKDEKKIEQRNPKGVECKESFNGKVAIKEKEEV